MDEIVSMKPSSQHTAENKQSISAIIQSSTQFTVHIKAINDICTVEYCVYIASIFKWQGNIGYLKVM